MKMRLVGSVLVALFWIALPAQGGVPGAFLDCGDNRDSGLWLFQEGTLVYGHVFYNRSAANLGCDPYADVDASYLPCAGIWQFGDGEIARVEIRWPAAGGQPTATFRSSALYDRIPVTLECRGSRHRK
jgi:hypothetical protein